MYGTIWLLMTTIKNTKVIPIKAKKYLYKVVTLAISNKKYRWGINIIEKYKQNYTLSENEIYRLALLYDHLAMKKIKIGHQKKLGYKYLKIAQQLYIKILHLNPLYFHAYYGIGRIHRLQGNMKKALIYQKKAFKYMTKLPIKERGALGIGLIYEQMKDKKNAEKWYLKERNVCLKNDFGTALNLFGFYQRLINKDKALFWGTITEKLLENEFKKNVYKGVNMKNSSFVKSIKAEINQLKDMINL